MWCSFRTARDRWEEEKDGTILRTILEVEELFDVSPVTYPAYPDTTVAVRSLREWRREADDEEEPVEEKAAFAPDRRRRLELAEAEG